MFEDYRAFHSKVLDLLWKDVLPHAPSLIADWASDPERYAGTELDGDDKADERDRLAEVAAQAAGGDEDAHGRLQQLQENYPEFMRRVVRQLLRGDGVEV